MTDWKPYVLLAIALYFYYNLLTSIKKGKIVWKIFTFEKSKKPTSFWLACVSQFFLASIFLGVAILYIFFFEELSAFLIRIS